MGGVTKRVPLGGGRKYLFSGWTSLPRAKLLPAGVSKNTSPGGALLVAPPPPKGTYNAHPLPPPIVGLLFGQFGGNHVVISYCLVDLRCELQQYNNKYIGLLYSSDMYSYPACSTNTQQSTTPPV